uniref:Uncharacterized protein n=1 Tax=Brugia timori TaxID=42155 RepID=A0A0R3QFU3_9BILA
MNIALIRLHMLSKLNDICGQMISNMHSNGVPGANNSIEMCRLNHFRIVLNYSFDQL